MGGGAESRIVTVAEIEEKITARGVYGVVARPDIVKVGIIGTGLVGIAAGARPGVFAIPVGRDKIGALRDRVGGVKEDDIVGVDRVLMQSGQGSVQLGVRDHGVTPDDFM